MQSKGAKQSTLVPQRGKGKRHVQNMGHNTTFFTTIATFGCTSSTCNTSKTATKRGMHQLHSLQLVPLTNHFLSKHCAPNDQRSWSKGHGASKTKDVHAITNKVDISSCIFFFYLVFVHRFQICAQKRDTCFFAFCHLWVCTFMLAQAPFVLCCPIIAILDCTDWKEDAKKVVLYDCFAITEIKDLVKRRKASKNNVCASTKLMQGH